MEQNKIYLGNNLDILKTFPDNSIDSVVTDPPYGLGKEPNVVEVMKDWIEKGYHDIKGKGFMGKEWDAFVPQPILWKEVFRVLKPGGHLLSFAGTRTYDWVVMGLRFAGFEIRDMLGWLYSSGFPKSYDVSKGIDSYLLNGKSNSKTLRKTEQDGDGKSYKLKGRNNGIMGEPREYDRKEFKPSSPEAIRWQGWGTALKPAIEPIVMARKPLQGTVAQNVLEYGVGGLNIDGCRVDFVSEEDRIGTAVGFKQDRCENNPSHKWGMKDNNEFKPSDKNGRFPANVIHDGSDEVVSGFPESKGASSQNFNEFNMYGGNSLEKSNTTRSGYKEFYDDEGSASRFFYTAKASKKDRDEGLIEFEKGKVGHGNLGNSNGFERFDTYGRNIHPTVKPTDLMQYLIRLVAPKGATILDPFMGSGSTGKAAMIENNERNADYTFIGIDLEQEYCDIAKARIEYGINYRENLATLEEQEKTVEGQLSLFEVLE